jgi:hypothetical protein
MLRSRRRDAAEAIGRRRRDAAAKLGEQRARHGMRRHANSDAVLPAGHDVIGNVAARGRTSVNGPGQNDAASLRAPRDGARPLASVAVSYRCTITGDRRDGLSQ